MDFSVTRSNPSIQVADHKRVGSEPDSIKNLEKERDQIVNQRKEMWRDIRETCKGGLFGLIFGALGALLGAVAHGVAARKISLIERNIEHLKKT